MRGQPHVDSSSQVMLPRSKVLTTLNLGGPLSPPLQHGLSPKLTSEHDAELLRLVAADTPSHRGAWTPNSRAWQTFTRRQDSKELVKRSRIPEEGEETEETYQLARDDYNGVFRPISGSVPINIVARSRLPKPLSLSSYRPLVNEARSSTNGDLSFTDSWPGNAIINFHP